MCENYVGDGASVGQIYVVRVSLGTAFTSLCSVQACKAGLSPTCDGPQEGHHESKIIPQRGLRPQPRTGPRITRMTRIKNGLIETVIRVIRLIRGSFCFSVTLIGVIRGPVLTVPF